MTNSGKQCRLLPARDCPQAKIPLRAMLQKCHEHFMAGRQVNWRKGRSVHIDTCLPKEYRLVQCRELAQSSVKINYIILVRSSDEQNGNCREQAQNY